MYVSMAVIKENKVQRNVCIIIIHRVSSDKNLGGSGIVSSPTSILSTHVRVYGTRSLHGIVAAGDDGSLVSDRPGCFLHEFVFRRRA